MLQVLSGCVFIAIGVGLLVSSARRVTCDGVPMTGERRQMLIEAEREQTSRMGGL